VWRNIVRGHRSVAPDIERRVKRAGYVIRMPTQNVKGS
jgi:ribosomal protein L34